MLTVWFLYDEIPNLLLHFYIYLLFVFEEVISLIIFVQHYIIVNFETFLSKLASKVASHTRSISLPSRPHRVTETLNFEGAIDQAKGLKRSNWTLLKIFMVCWWYASVVNRATSPRRQGSTEQMCRKCAWMDPSECLMLVEQAKTSCHRSSNLFKILNHPYEEKEEMLGLLRQLALRQV